MMIAAPYPPLVTPPSASKPPESYPADCCPPIVPQSGGMLTRVVTPFIVSDFLYPAPFDDWKSGYLGPKRDGAVWDATDHSDLELSSGLEGGEDAALERSRPHWR